MKLEFPRSWKNSNYAIIAGTLLQLLFALNEVIGCWLKHFFIFLKGGKFMIV